MKNIYTIITVVVILITGTVIFSGIHNTEAAILSDKTITVHKTPTCSCCGEYVKYLKAQGAEVTIIEHQNLTEKRAEHGIPTSLESCHYSEVDDYVLEGHIPAEAINKLVEDQPAIIGIALPGMPAGSPGMGGTKLSTFTIYQFNDTESSEVFMSI